MHINQKYTWSDWKKSESCVKKFRTRTLIIITKVFNNDSIKKIQINSLYQFAFGFFVSWILLLGVFSNEIALLETDSTHYITRAQMQCGIASVGSVEISGFDSKVFFKFITLMIRPVKIINAAKRVKTNVCMWS